MRIFVLAAAASLLCLPALAQQELWFDYCKTQFDCEERQAVASGEVCDDWIGNALGKRYTGELVGGEPDPGYEFAGWRCGQGAELHPPLSREELVKKLRDLLAEAINE